MSDGLKLDVIHVEKLLVSYKVSLKISMTILPYVQNASNQRPKTNLRLPFAQKV